MSLTRKQANRINKVIAKDASLRHRYIGSSYRDPVSHRRVFNSCAIGGLALAANISLDDVGIDTRIGQETELAEALTEEYGLTFDDLTTIQYLNDRNPNQMQRRAHIIGYVNEQVTR